LREAQCENEKELDTLKAGTCSYRRTTTVAPLYHYYTYILQVTKPIVVECPAIVLHRRLNRKQGRAALMLYCYN